MKCFLLLASVSSLLMSLGAHANPLPSSTTRTSPQDLEVFDIGPDGQKSSSRFYTYAQLETLPQVTVKTNKDPNTDEPATYTGVYVRDLFSALGAKPGQDVIGSTCYDKYKDYYDSLYIQKHQPIFLLKYDNKLPAQWPKAFGTMALGPYCIVHERFVPAETIYGYVEPPRIPFGVISLELTTNQQAFASFAPKKDADNPEVIKGQHIAMGSCIMCHNTPVAGGLKASQPWAVLSVLAASNGDFFRGYVVNPQKFNSNSPMPPHPNFDAQTLDALQAYFKAMP